MLFFIKELYSSSIALSHSRILDASLNDYGYEAMTLYACGNDLFCDLVLQVSKGLPTNKHIESKEYHAQRGLVEEEGMSSTICGPYDDGGL